MRKNGKILAVDVGNTHVCFGVYSGRVLEVAWRIRTDPKETEDELKVTLTQLFLSGQVAMDEICGAIVASVVPPLTDTMTSCLRQLFGSDVILVAPGMETGIKLLMDNPSEVGADRIVNAVAAAVKYPGGSIVVDMGTATTFDCISPHNEYLGGAIAPGIAISSEALFLRAAKLPKVEIARPPSCIGKNTVASMQSGIFFGYASLIDGMVGKIRSELDFNPRVIATGGYASLLAPAASTIEIVDPHLTLDGLAILYEKNL